jgi:diguanylate cyclase (GGDEF)-like protein
LILFAIFLVGVMGYLPVNPYPYQLTAFARFITSVSLCLALVWVVWRFSLMVRTLLFEIDGLSKTDYLTGALNRRGVEFVLSNDVARAQRNSLWLSIIIIDIDHFKRFNDLNGHKAGDQCLVFVCSKIQECLNRKSDVLGRYGGEEFIVILPDTDIAGAARVAENIRFAVASARKPYAKDRDDCLTLTLGVAGGRGKNVESSEQIVTLADKMLYDGKRSGRNRVSVGALTPTSSPVFEVSQQ